MFVARGESMKVMITGGTGSLGHALVERYISTGAERIIIYSRDEVKQAEMRRRFDDHPSLRFRLGDVRDRSRLDEVLHDSPDAVIHAAALKRVDTVAYETGEAQKTNVMGTTNVVEACIDAGVSRVLFVSSDKAVHPANYYGTTKLAAEGQAIGLNSRGYPRGTRISVVRYGNVWGSRGSVQQTWRKQLADLGHVKLTHEDMTRFVILLPQAVDLVFYALDNMRGGEIVVPVLPSMRMKDLANVLCTEESYEVCGLRPGGEKLHEQLVSDEEVSRTYCPDPMHYIVAPASQDWGRYGWSGTRLDPGYRYTSDRNAVWLSERELFELWEEFES